VVVHVDETALRGGAGRADLPLETVKRLACDASLVVVTEDERGAPLNVGRKQRTVTTAIRRALWSRRWQHSEVERANPAMEVREDRGVYRLAIAAVPTGSTSRRRGAARPRT
jgi:hypothetical protein